MGVPTKGILCNPKKGNGVYPNVLEENKLRHISALAVHNDGKLMHRNPSAMTENYL